MIIVLSLHPLSGRVAGRERGKQTETRVLKKKVSKKFRKDFAEQKSGIIFADAFPRNFGDF